MKLDKGMIAAFKEQLGYDEEEMNIFLENPRNIDVLSKSATLLNKTIIIEVIDSHGCNSQHKKGDKFYFDGTGNLITKLSPKRICIYALAAVEKLIFASNELIYKDLDPNDMLFKRTSCFDVGLKCGGWGKIIMEIKVIDRDKI